MVEKYGKLIKTLFNYEPEQVKLSLNEMSNGMHVATAGKLYGVPRSTLRHKIAGGAPETTG